MPDLGAARLAQVLGELWLKPLDPERFGWLRSLPGFEELPADLWQGSADHWAARHHGVLDREVPLYASVFLEADGHLGGAVTASAADRMAAFGVRLEPDAPAADHGGLAFLFLGDLLRWEAQARAAGDAEAAARFVDGQRAWLGGQLLYWWPDAVLALRRAGDPFYAHLGEMSLEFLSTLADSLRPSVGSMPPIPSSPDLDDVKTGMHRIAGFLGSPASCGVYWGRKTLREWSQQLEVPCGFGPRREVLETLLRTTGELSLGGQGLMRLMQASLDEWLAELDVLAEQKAIRPWIEGRRSRFAEAAVVIQRLHEGFGETRV